MLWYILKCEVVLDNLVTNGSVRSTFTCVLKTMICIYFSVLQLPVLTLRKAKYVWKHVFMLFELL